VHAVSDGNNRSVANVRDDNERSDDENGRYVGFLFLIVIIICRGRRFVTFHATHCAQSSKDLHLDKIVVIIAGVPQGGILSIILVHVYAYEQPVMRDTLVADYADNSTFI